MERSHDTFGGEKVDKNRRNARTHPMFDVRREVVQNIHQ